jgi:exodeoxyribonuclease-3
MRLATWNVNGLRAIAGKTLFAFLDDEDPDLLLLQETKAGPDALPDELRRPAGFYAEYASGRRKGYSGVAIWSRLAPDEWIRGLGCDEFDAEGRLLAARFGELVVISAYFPNSQDEGGRLAYKLAFDAAIEAFLDAQVAQGRHVIVGADFNVAHQEIDIARPQENATSAGFLPEERAWFTRLLAKGYRDAWRARHPEARDVYTWWDLRTLARSRNVGWRIDGFVVDEGLWPRVRACEVRSRVEGSDHCPVALDLGNAE